MEIKRCTTESTCSLSLSSSPPPRLPAPPVLRERRGVGAGDGGSDGVVEGAGDGGTDGNGEEVGAAEGCGIVGVDDGDALGDGVGDPVGHAEDVGAGDGTTKSAP